MLAQPRLWVSALSGSTSYLGFGHAVNLKHALYTHIRSTFNLIVSWFGVPVIQPNSLSQENSSNMLHFWHLLGVEGKLKRFFWSEQKKQNIFCSHRNLSSQTYCICCVDVNVFMSLIPVSNVLSLKVAAVDLMRRRMLWEAGPGPGGSFLTSRGTPSLLRARRVTKLSFTHVVRATWPEIHYKLIHTQ